MKVSVSDLDDFKGTITEKVSQHAVRVKQYQKDVYAAIEFGKNPDPATAFELLKVGCALTNLTIIPADMVSDPRAWFVKLTFLLSPDSEKEYFYFLRADDYLRFL